MPDESETPVAVPQQDAIEITDEGDYVSIDQTDGLGERMWVRVHKHNLETLIQTLRALQEL